MGRRRALVLGPGPLGLVASCLNLLAAGTAAAASSDEPGTDASPAPRSGTVASYHLGMAGGFATFERSAATRGGVGGTAVVHFTGGIALWDRLPVHVGFGSMSPSDRTPFYEEGIFCSTDENGETCSEPEVGKSSVSGGYLIFETGYQQRWRLSSVVALVPAGLVGYLWNVEGFSRRVGCEGCRSLSVDVDASGGYVAPSLRVVFGDPGSFGLSARTNWFLTGDLQHMTLFGLEFLAP